MFRIWSASRLEIPASTADLSSGFADCVADETGVPEF
jgi:hypothetical protein